MHPMLFEYWWRNESARVQRRAEMAAAVREARLGSAPGRSSRAVRVGGTVGSGWRRVRLTPEKSAAMKREIPHWLEEMDGRGVRLLGRQLDLPETAVTVRVQDGETLVTDGPFADTKEFIGGFSVISCDDRAQAIEIAAAHPLARHHRVEVRPFVCE